MRQVGKVVARIELSAARQLLVTIERGDDGARIDFRAHTRINAAAAIFMPTASGFALSPEAALALIEALQAALAQIGRESVGEGCGR